jgi:Ca2+-binding EF-hand superfamily protein
MKPPKPFDPITFDDIDDDGNNKITFEELKSYLLKRNYDENTIEDLFKTYDIDNDGSISRAEFNNLKLIV